MQNCNKTKIALVVIDMSQEEFYPKGLPVVRNWIGFRNILSLAKLLSKEVVFDTRLWTSNKKRKMLQVDWNFSSIKFKQVGKPGTTGAKLCSELAELENFSTFLKKAQYSAFFESELHEKLQAQGVNVIMLSGMNTDYCVLASALDAFNLGYKVWLIQDACATTTGKDGHYQGIHEFKNLLGDMGNVIMTADAVELINSNKLS